MSNTFDSPCTANGSALILAVCGYALSTRAGTAVAERWPASDHFFEPRGPSNCFSVSHFGVMCARLGLCSGDILSTNGPASPIFSKDSMLFRGSKACQNSGRHLGYPL